MVWNALNCFSKNNLKQIKMQILQIQKNQDAENLHLEIQSIENQVQLNTYLSSTKESSMKELNSTAFALPKKRHRAVRKNMPKQLL